MRPATVRRLHRPAAFALALCTGACTTGGGDPGAAGPPRRSADAAVPTPPDAGTDAVSRPVADVGPTPAVDAAARPTADARGPTADAALESSDLGRRTPDADHPDAMPPDARSPDAGPSPEVCAGGIDEDHDGRIDCCDPDCAADCGPVQAPAYSEAQVQALFDERCEVCHMNGRADGTLALDAPFLRTTLDVGSEQLRTMVYIKAGDRTGSYLFHKVADTHHDIGGAGAPMPFDVGLCREEIERLGRYIDGL
jgi:hypothetical protein